MTGDVAAEAGVVVRPTPTVIGYFMAVLVAVLMSPWLVLALAAVEGPVAEAPGIGVVLGIIVFGMLVAAFVGIPAALLVIPVLHVVLSRVEQQWIHVLAFGAGAALAIQAELLLANAGSMRESWTGLAALSLVGGVAAGIGRLAVSGERWRVHPTADWMRELHR